MFDAFLAALTIVTAPRVTSAIARVTSELLGWPGVARSRHRLGGRQFNCRGVELGHIHSNGVVDLRLTRREHDEVLGQKRAEPHHVVPEGTWVTYYLGRDADEIRQVSELFRIPFERILGSNTEASDEMPSGEG
jgi:hypothetical protein